jgi:hypothetical protein
LKPSESLASSWNAYVSIEERRFMMEKYESENSEELLVEFMDRILKTVNHTTIKPTKVSQNILSSEIKGSFGQTVALGMITLAGKNFMAVTYCGQERDWFLKKAEVNNIPPY